MALTILETPNLRIAKETDLEHTGAAANDDVFNGPCTVYGIFVSNVAASHAACYLKLYNSLAPTYGTTVPEIVIPIADSMVGFIPLNLPDGMSFATGLSMAAATTGGTVNTAAPAGSLTVEVYASPAA